MTITRGDSIPEARLSVMGSDGPRPVTTTELMGSGRVVLFAVPGAFTPTCSVQHLPGYVRLAGEILDNGVDRIVCLAVNDVFVMNAWGKSAGVGEKIVMAADGNGEFTRALGLELDATGFGMGKRAQRFALIAEDGRVRDLFVEAPGEFRVSSAEYVLDQLGSAGGGGGAG